MRLERTREFLVVRPELKFDEGGILLPLSESSELSDSSESQVEDNLFNKLGGLKTIKKITE
jgi:hypothetical protein